MTLSNGYETPFSVPEGNIVMPGKRWKLSRMSPFLLGFIFASCGAGANEGDDFVITGGLAGGAKEQCFARFVQIDESSRELKRFATVPAQVLDLAAICNFQSRDGGT